MYNRSLLMTVAAGFALVAPQPFVAAPEKFPGRKIRDVMIYSDPLFHATFPSVVRRPDGELLVAFRRAPNRHAYGEARNHHVDANANIVGVRSRDGGATWSATPEPIFAHPFGGSQDPCLLQLRDGTLLCMSYGWSFIRADGMPKLKTPFFQNIPGVVSFGGYYLRSVDGGKSWTGPFSPPPVSSEVFFTPHGQLLPALNRGALHEGRDGRIFWVVASFDRVKPIRASTHLLISSDKGLTWDYSCPVASGAPDSKEWFDETSVYETPKGDIVAFLRSEDYDDQACIARSLDGGKSFQPWQGMGFKGHPLHALKLPDQRVLLVYGYRHPPYGIRARILNAECTDFAAAPEIVLRDDGGGPDLGYPWSEQIDAKHVLVSYYFNRPGIVQHIAGTILEIP